MTKTNEIKLRKLRSTDLGLFSKIISKLEVRKDVTNMFFDIGSKKPAQLKAVEKKLAADGLLLLLENYWKAEKELHQLLASLSSRSQSEIEELPLNELIEMLKEILKDESLPSFLKLLA